jgi:hypothetical protein
MMLSIVDAKRRAARGHRSLSDVVNDAPPLLPAEGSSGRRDIRSEMR